MRAGVRVDFIQVLFTDGVKNTYSPIFGGMGGVSQGWEVPHDEYITQVEYFNGADMLHGFGMITNKGTKSPFFGQASIVYHLVTFPQDYRVIGVYGRCGTEVDKLGFVLGKTVYPNASDPYSPNKPLLVDTMHVSLE